MLTRALPAGGRKGLPDSAHLAQDQRTWSDATL